MSNFWGVLETEYSTNWFFSGAKPDTLRRVRGIRARSEDRQDRTQPLRSRLSSAKYVQVPLSRASEVGCSMDIQVEIERST